MHIRCITPSDANAYRSILTRTTEEDRYCRFFHVVNHFDLSDIARYVDVRDDTFGYIAEEPDGVGEVVAPLGVAHAFATEPGHAEIAIVVAGDARRRGVGRELLARLIGELRRRNCKHVTAFSLSGNHGFASLARSVGMHPVDSAPIVRWELPFEASQDVTELGQPVEMSEPGGA
jgi:GNAT superfamily N-acetyltransferase